MTTLNLQLPPTSRLYGLAPQAIPAVVATAQALALGRANEAHSHIASVAAQYPNHPEVLRLLAGIHNLRGRRADAIALMERAICARPDDALYYNTLGSVLIAACRYDAAIAALERACTLDPNLASAWYNLGIVLMRSVRPEESAAALQRAIALDPNNSARAMLGDMLKASGRIDEAAAQYRSVIAEQPPAGMAWWGLANIKTTRFKSGDIEQMRHAMAHPDASDDELIALGYSLAKALDDEGCYAASLAALDQAKGLSDKRGIWDAARFSASTDEGIAMFAQPAGSTTALGNEVVFIVGLPRSGTTLVEQILASHSNVEGGGELPDLPLVLSEESERRRTPFPQWVPQMQPADWERLGRRYLERTAHRRQSRPRFTDKLPNNWFYIGAISAMLPAARIVCCRRDPLETCLSCYRQHFAGNEYANHFGTLAAFWRDFDRVATHWRKLRPLHIYENIYEELVSAPERKIRELLVFCGLDFEPACVQFHKTERSVHTPSAAQVREPMRRDTARAMRYGALLNHLRAELGMAPYHPEQ